MAAQTSQSSAPYSPRPQKAPTAHPPVSIPCAPSRLRSRLSPSSPSAASRARTWQMHSRPAHKASPPYASSPTRKRSPPTSAPCKTRTQSCNDLAVTQASAEQTAAPPVVLTIAGLDPSGGAGLVADVQTIAAFGCFATAVATSLTFQNTTGVRGAAHQSAETVSAQVLPVVAAL